MGLMLVIVAAVFSAVGVLMSRALSTVGMQVLVSVPVLVSVLRHAMRMLMCMRVPVLVFMPVLHGGTSFQGMHCP